MYKKIMEFVKNIYSKLNSVVLNQDIYVNIYNEEIILFGKFIFLV